MHKNINITVLYNLPEDLNLEADIDTQNSAKEIYKVLMELGYSSSLLGIGKNDIKKIFGLKTDLVFNLTEWSGKDFDYSMEVIRILEENNIAFTGSGYEGLLISNNKILMKEKMKSNNIPTPNWQVFLTGSEKLLETLNFPLILKPAYEHCGMGISQKSVVANKEEFYRQLVNVQKEYKEPILAEEYIEGREIHLTILEKDGEPWMLPPAEVAYQDSNFWKILSYEMKWQETSQEYELADMTLAKLGEDLLKKLNNLASLCYKKLHGKDYPRLDIRIKNNEIYVLEINNNPGLDDDLQSGVWVSAKAAGFTFPSLIDHIVKNNIHV